MTRMGNGDLQDLGRGPSGRAIPWTVGALLLLSIWVGSLTHHRGLVRYDSDYYLRQAAFFVEDRGVRSRGHVEPAPFTVWPLGYPATIAAAAEVTGLPVFWAAKVVNSVAALLIIVLLVKGLPATGWIACLALLSAGMVNLFASTFAEGIFCLALVVVALSLARVLERSSVSAAFILATAVGAAFSIRWVGAVLVGPVVAAGLWAYAHGQHHRARLLAGALVGAASLVGAYMLLTWWIAGFLMPPRVPRKTSVSTFVYETTKAFVSELNVAFLSIPNPRDIGALLAFSAVLGLTLAVGIHLWRRGRRNESGLDRLAREERVTLIIFALIGAFFWVVMATLKFRAYFNPLDFRYLGPGTLLVTVAGLGTLMSWGLWQHRGAKTVFACIVVATVIHTCIYVPLQRYRDNGILFTEEMDRLRSQYEGVPAGAVVLQSSLHVLFLRPDLIVVPVASNSSQALFDRVRDQAIEAGKPVWIERDGRPVPIDTSHR